MRKALRTAVILSASALLLAGCSAAQDDGGTASGSLKGSGSGDSCTIEGTVPLGAALSLTGAAVRFGTVTALHEVDLRVYRGDFIALVGANGSGKTTLLHALHGLVAHSGSRVVGTPSMAMGTLRSLAIARMTASC